MIEQKKKLQIVVLNTNLMIGLSRQQESIIRNDIDDEARRQWDWLDTVLTKCMHNKEVVSRSQPNVFRRTNN